MIAFQNKKSFTLIEILVVATIIALLATTALISYSTFTQQSRNARRKADLEQIRAALEMYRSNSATSSYPASIDFSSCSSAGSLTDGSNTYLSKIPNDPQCGTATPYLYYYTQSASSYTLGAYLEGETNTCAGTPSCGSKSCNYTVGPYGQTCP